MNSLYKPTDSLKPILHFPYVNMNMKTSCYYCNEAIEFNKSSNRYVGKEGILCRKMGAK